MRNSFTDYKILFSTFSYDEKINEVTQKIHQLVNKKQHGNMKDTPYDRIKDLNLKNNVVNRF